jgi:1-acyl-sn-glycerol-3-phosphate acyltransferase
MVEATAARRTLDLVRELSEHPRPLDRSTRLQDLGFDSLAFAELAAALEDEQGIDVGDPHLHGTGTVGDLLEVVERADVARSTVDVPSGVGRLQRPAGVVGGIGLRAWIRLEVLGAEGVPRDGPAVLAMNHESALDIPIIVVASPRSISFMAKRELFKGACRSWSLHELGGFRVDRERFDLRAIRIALAVLGRGGVLGMYPEGTRSPGGLLPFLPGAAWMAVRTGAPLVPVALTGTDRTDLAKRPRRARVRVTFGRPIPVERVDHPVRRRRTAEELTRTLREVIEGLLSA